MNVPILIKLQFTSCANGYYSKRRQRSCTQCPAGSSCPSLNEPLVISCPLGTYAEAGEMVCIFSLCVKICLILCCLIACKSNILQIAILKLKNLIITFCCKNSSSFTKFNLCLRSIYADFEITMIRNHIWTYQSIFSQCKCKNP